MEFKFVVTEKDFVDFNVFYAQNFKFVQKQKKIFRFIFALLPVLVILIFLPIESIFSNIYLSTFFIALSLILSISIFRFYPKFDNSAIESTIYKILKERKHDFPFEMTISFEDDKIISTKKFENVSMGYEKN